MAEEIARHLTTKDKLVDVETNYASISDAMEKEKNCHKETIDKLAIEESNHMITQTKLTESKDKLVEEIAKQEDLIQKLGNEQSNLIQIQQSFDLVQQENVVSQVHISGVIFKYHVQSIIMVIVIFSLVSNDY